VDESKRQIVPAIQMTVNIIEWPCWWVK